MKRALLLAACALPSCAIIDGLGGEPQPPPAKLRVGIFDVATIDRDIDILFVIDNSSEMLALQTGLANDMPEMLNAMQAGVAGGFPNVHIGVVSSNMGAGGQSFFGCNGTGDNGALTLNGCTGVTGSFVSDLLNPSDGSRTKNYTGTLSTVLSCMVKLGENGCGFEQHLAAMQTALSPGHNTGFYRANAHLLVVILGNEDDCSVSNGMMFDPQNTSLGFLSSYRCFQWGVACDSGNDDPSATGARNGCHSRTDSPYMAPATDFAQMLRGLKTDPARVMVAAIVGDPTPVAVQLDDMQHPALVHSCTSGTSHADPAVRIDELTAQFPARALRESICTDLGYPLARIGALAANSIGRKDASNAPLFCLVGADDPSLDHLQRGCTVSWVTDPGLPTEADTAMPRCADQPDAAPCWTIQADTLCDLDNAHGRLVVSNAPTTPPASLRYVVDCPPVP